MDYEEFDVDRLLDQAASLAQDERYQEARSVVKRVIREEPFNIEAWWALTHLATSDAERNNALKEVLKLDPDHMHALHMRDQLRAGSIASIDTGGYSPSLKSSKDPLPRSMFEESKDFLLPAIFVLIAYWVFWFAGLALNIYYLRQARRLQRDLGASQKNAGCLYALLGLQAAQFILMVLGMVIYVASSTYGNTF